MLPDFLPSIDQERIKEINESLGEDPDRVANNVKLLEEWIKHQTHLPQNYDRCVLPSFLRGCNQNLEKSKRKIEACCIARNTQLDVFGNIDTSYDGDLRVRNFMHIAILPKLTPEGYRITIMQKYVPFDSVYDVEKMLRYIVMLATMRLHHDLHQVAGELIIIDCRKVIAKDVAKFLCNTTRKCLELLEPTLPLKLKRVLIITDISIVVKAMGVIKPFFKEKLRNRLHVLSNLELLTTYVPVDCLPFDYGGELKTIKEYSDHVYDYVNKCDLFERLETMKITGEIPKHNLFTFSNQDFGMDGSFRQLNLD